MLRLIQRLLGNKGETKKQLRTSIANRWRLELENLESRELKAADISVINGDLYIHGTNGADDIEVNYNYTTHIYSVTDNQRTTTGKPLTTVTNWQVPGGDIFFYGNNGDDKFKNNNTHLRTTAYGGFGNDTILGSYEVDKIYGGDGNDTIRGGHAKDQIYGQNGDDTIYGGADNDMLDGGANADIIYGEGGIDIVIAGMDFAPNQLYGGFDDDTVIGGKGDDSIYGGEGHDLLDGGLGADEVFGEGGNDRIFLGNDALGNYAEGGAGNDVLKGSAGPDGLFGGTGNDFLYGYGGDDLLSDTSGRDELHGGDDNDELRGINYSPDDVTSFYGEAGKDTFYIDYRGHFWPIHYTPPVSIDHEPGEIIYEGGTNAKPSGVGGTTTGTR